jgi:hypothetical protein
VKGGFRPPTVLTRVLPVLRGRTPHH